MIGFKHRFHGHGSLRYVYQHGKTVRGPLCALKYAENDRRQDYRLAIVVGKKVHKSAVVRNRIRRRMYESFREQVAPNLNHVYDMVITVFADTVATMPTDQLNRMMLAQAKQASILAKRP